MRTFEVLIKFWVVTIFAIAMVSGTSLDTIKPVEEFSSPIANPRAIEWDGSNFWISSMNRPYIFKLDQSMLIVDSINTVHSRISAIASGKNHLWITVDSATKDTSIDQRTFKFFRIYNINTQSHTIVDSISFMSDLLYSEDTGFVSGLAIHNDSIYVSLNALCSSGIYQVDSSSRTLTQFNFQYFSGICFIGDLIWGIRLVYASPEGCEVTNIVRKDISPLAIDYYATDIAIVNNFIWLCNMRDSKLIKSQLPSTGTHPIHNPKSYSLPNNKSKVVLIHYTSMQGSSLINLNGQKLQNSNFKRHVQQMAIETSPGRK